MIRETLDSGLARFQVKATDSLAGSLDKLKGGEWSAVLLDLSLPDSDSIVTFRAIHAAAPETPVIVLTGHSDEELAVASVQEGAKDYLIKGRV